MQNSRATCKYTEKVILNSGIQEKRPRAGKPDQSQVDNKNLLMPKNKKIKAHFVE